MWQWLKVWFLIFICRLCRGLQRCWGNERFGVDDASSWRRTRTSLTNWSSTTQATRLRGWPNFIELLSTNICWAWHFFLDKKQDYQPNFHLLLCLLLVFSCCLLFVQIKWKFGCNPVLSRQKFHAKQFFVLSSSLKLGPCLRWMHIASSTANLMINNGKP